MSNTDDITDNEAKLLEDRATALGAGTQIDRGEVKLMWDTMFYDGPMAGVCEWEGRDYYYSCVFEDWFRPHLVGLEPSQDWNLETDGAETTNVRVFHLFDVGEDIMAALWADHARFRRHVGHHTSRFPTGRFVGPVRDRATVDAYFAARKHDPYTPPDVTNCKVVATFEN